MRISDWSSDVCSSDLHRDDREQLQHVVLHHVAQRADAVIIGHAPLEPDRLGDGDLDMVDRLRVPQRFEQPVGKAQREQILDRFLAEIMVDAEDAVLGRSEEHTSELQSLMRTSYAVFCLKKKKQ